MTELAIEEIKKIQLELLDEVDLFCKNNNISYYLYYGSLIGAIRHQGYIPWDDDIDILMPRPDYDKFCELYKRNSNNKYRLFTVDSKDYIYPFAKISDTTTAVVEKWMLTNVLGVNIDIFPLDGVPENLNRFKCKARIVLAYHYIQQLTSREQKARKTFVMTVLSYLLYYPLKFFGQKYWLRRIDKIIRAIDYNSSNYVGNFSIDTYIKKERFKKEWFSGSINMLFEGKKYPVPIGYDSVLKALYGRYMELPPKEKRVNKHENKAYKL